MRAPLALSRHSNRICRDFARLHLPGLAHFAPGQAAPPIRSGRGWYSTETAPLQEDSSSAFLPIVRSRKSAQEHVRDIARQDPYGRITYVPPVWFFSRPTETGVINGILDHFVCPLSVLAPLANALSLMLYRSKPTSYRFGRCPRPAT